MTKIAALLLALVVLSPCVYADMVTLKDDQQFSAEVTSFDSYFLVVKLENNKIVNIPWREVRFVKHTTTASSWLEDTYINKEDTEVSTLISPISEDKAFWNSVFPGLVIHGSGHFYAKNQGVGMSLLSAEIVSVIIMAVSVNEVLTPVQSDQSTTVSKAVFFTGLTMFAASWLWDMIFTKSAVAEYNSTHDFILNDKNQNTIAIPEQTKNLAPADTIKKP